MRTGRTGRQTGSTRYYYLFDSLGSVIGLHAMGAMGTWKSTPSAVGTGTCRVLSIFAGTTEIMKQIIGKMMGL